MPSCHACHRKPGPYCWQKCPGPADTDHHGRAHVEYNDKTHTLQRKPDDQPASNLPGMEDVRLFLGAWLSLSKRQKDVVAWRLFHPTAQLSQFYHGQRNAKLRTNDVIRNASRKHEIIARILDRPAIGRGRT